MDEKHKLSPLETTLSREPSGAARENRPKSRMRRPNFFYHFSFGYFSIQVLSFLLQGPNLSTRLYLQSLLDLYVTRKWKIEFKKWTTQACYVIQFSLNYLIYTYIQINW